LSLTLFGEKKIRNIALEKKIPNIAGKTP